MDSAWPLIPSIGALVAAAAVLVVAGTRLARVADGLSERTGLGRALGGALLLGAVTSLPGIIATATGSLEGDAEFALANAVGGVAIQSVWLAIADLVYRRVNLEHAAASLENIMQALILVALLAVPVIAYATPDLRLGWIHPATLAIPVLYLYGLHLLGDAKERPMWLPRRTSDTEDQDTPPEASREPLGRLWLWFAALAVIVGVTGWVLAEAGLGLIAATGWSSAITGFTVTTAISSLPELVTLIAAVRMGALTLGVGNIIGGNVFDTLLIAIADLFYLEGSMYAEASQAALVLLGGTIVITAVLAIGLIVRQRRGIGFEGVAIPGAYLLTVGLAVTVS